MVAALTQVNNPLCVVNQRRSAMPSHGQGMPRSAAGAGGIDIQPCLAAMEGAKDEHLRSYGGRYRRL